MMDILQLWWSRDDDVETSSMWTTILAILVGGLVLIVFASTSKRRRRSFIERLPPTPPSNKKLGILGSLKLFIGSKGPMVALQWARKVGGNYTFRLPGLEYQNQQFIVIGDPQLGRKLLENPKGFKPWQVYLLFDKAANGPSFFGSNDPRGLHVRKSTNSTFNPTNLQRNMTPIVHSVLQEWIQTRLEPIYVQTGRPLDIDSEMMLVTTDVISRAVFDYPMSKAERVDFTNTMKFVMETFFKERLNPINRLMPWLFAKSRKCRRLAQELHTKFAKRILESCRSEQTPNINSLTYQIINDQDYKNDEERACDILLYFFAGYDTTAHSIAWTIIELAKHPIQQDILRLALKKYSQQQQQAQSDKPTTSLAHCPHLKYVTKEALRLHGPAALGPARSFSEDIIIPRPESTTKEKTVDGSSEDAKLTTDTTMIIPKGSICQICLYVTMRNHNIFERPDEFIPSRWEHPTIEMQRAYYPFALGRRNCQGMGLAQLELSLAVSEMISKYKFDIVNTDRSGSGDGKEGEPEYMVTLRPKGYLLSVKAL